jgi:hypothetical protein
MFINNPPSNFGFESWLVMARQLRERLVHKTAAAKGPLNVRCQRVLKPWKRTLKVSPAMASPTSHSPLKMSLKKQQPKHASKDLSEQPSKEPSKQLSTHASERFETSNYKFMIMALPTEIHLKVIQSLDYKALLNISATNNHFRELFLYQDKRLFKLALLDFEEKSSAWRTSITREITYAPCYGCLKTLSKCHFRSFAWASSSTSTGPRAFNRRCQTCSCREPLTGPSRVIKDNGPWLYCGGCKEVTHLVAYEACGVWDHTRNWKVDGESRHPLRPEVSLCRECMPENWSDDKGKYSTVHTDGESDDKRKYSTVHASGEGNELTARAKRYRARLSRQDN